jgi:hypothetical protein
MEQRYLLSTEVFNLQDMLLEKSKKIRDRQNTIICTAIIDGGNILGRIQGTRLAKRGRGIQN